MEHEGVETGRRLRVQRHSGGGELKGRIEFSECKDIDCVKN